jgi:hypothetical protein
VVFEPSGQLFAVSTDYPFVRVFDQGEVLPFSALRGVSALQGAVPY